MARQYVYEIYDVKAGADRYGVKEGQIIICDARYGCYSDYAFYDEDSHSVDVVGRRHFLFEIKADIKTEREEAIAEMKEKLAKKRKFITRDKNL